MCNNDKLRIKLLYFEKYKKTAILLVSLIIILWRTNENRKIGQEKAGFDK